MHWLDPPSDYTSRTHGPAPAECHDATRQASAIWRLAPRASERAPAKRAGALLRVNAARSLGRCRWPHTALPCSARVRQRGASTGCGAVASKLGHSGADRSQRSVNANAIAPFGIGDTAHGRRGRSVVARCGRRRTGWLVRARAASPHRYAGSGGVRCALPQRRGRLVRACARDATQGEIVPDTFSVLDGGAAQSARFEEADLSELFAPLRTLSRIRRSGARFKERRRHRQ